MITILIQPAPVQLEAVCEPLFERFKARLDSSQRMRLQGGEAGGKSGKRRALSLLARALILNYLPGHTLRQLPGMRLMAGETFVSLSYSANCVFCGFGSQPLGLDAEEMFASAKSWVMAEFYRRLRGAWPLNMGRSALTRAWTVCEAIIKLAGTGWTAEARAMLGQLPFERRQSAGHGPDSPVSWRAIAFHGHWLGIASAERPEPITCKLLPAFAL